MPIIFLCMKFIIANEGVDLLLYISHGLALLYCITTLTGGFLVTNYHDGGARFQKVAWTEEENKRDHYF